MKHLRWWLSLAGVWICCATTPAYVVQDEPAQEVAEEREPAFEAPLQALLAEVEGATCTPEQALPLFQACMRQYGRLDPLEERLQALLADLEETQSPRWKAVQHVRGQLHWRNGTIQVARQAFATLAEDRSDIAARLQLAKLWDAEGKLAEASEAYRELLPEVDAATAERLQIRLALMELAKAGSAQNDSGDSPNPLAEFAAGEERSAGLRNRAAIVLALLGQPGEAIDLYRAEGEPKARFVGELRLAEWGMAAERFDVAQEAAWRAVELAPIARERRYALTLLAESHRRGQAVPALLERFETHAADLSGEARSLWIELLRETEQFDRAIALVQGERGEAGFSDEEQRELFEMYREADREEDLIAAYRERMRQDPASVTWREGLARYYLEKGQREQALGIWEDWFGDLAEGQHLMGADALMALGLDEWAERAAEDAIRRAAEGAPTSAKSNPDAAMLFLFDLYRDRGRLEEARAVLERLDAHAPPDAPVRLQLADAFERIGDQRKAVATLTGIVESRPEGEAGEDVEMRLAWLQSEVGQEEKALTQWRSLWERVNSVPRRRYVEDRMMTVASRLGTLATVAVELEEKLFAGTANERESGLLVRLYTKVGDSVSAAEVIEEFMRRSGGSEIETLTEKARVYLACNDYYHYERAVKRLIEIDPEGEPDYLRQLAMSQLERGQPKEAREVLMRLAALETDDSSSAEFEAGVLSLSGMRAEAIEAYRKGLAGHPDRIDAYILMAGLMKQLGQADQAVGMFQFLAENAERDDLFTIAIDGILNMLVDAPPRPKTVAWARRITLERLAARHDKPYLYQLLSDLASEANDHDGHLLALESALASAGPRRASMLRELMDLTIERRSTFAGPGWPGDKAKHLAMGRRLVGLAEAVPPQVYLDLGTAFLKAKDERAAERTFALTRNLPDGAMYQRDAAGSFEQEGFVERSLDLYESVLATLPSDVPLLAKVGELHENLGDDRRAAELYRRAMDLLLRRRELAVDPTAEEEEPKNYWSANRNVDDFSQNYDRILNGVLATLRDEAEMEEYLAAQSAAFHSEAPGALEANADSVAAMRAEQQAQGVREDDWIVRQLTQHPRLYRRVELYRRVALAYGRTDLADELDRYAMELFPEDDELLETVVRDRLGWGQVGSAKTMIEASGRSDEERRELLVKVGEVVESGGSTPIPLAEAARQLLPLIAEGRVGEIEAVVRRADLAKVEDEEMSMVGVIFAAARYVDKEDLILKVGRDWLRLKIASPQSYGLEDLFGQIGSALSPANELALGRYVVSRVFEDPEKNASLVTQLPAIANKFDEALVSSEQLLTLLDGFGERYAWGLGPVITLLPPDARAGAMRNVWPKIEKSQRASLLLDIVTEVQGELGDEFSEFIRGSLGDALQDAPPYIEYSISQLIDVEGKDQLVLDLADVLLEKGWDQVQSLPAIRALRLHAMGEEGAEDLAVKAWIALGADDDYRSREAMRKLGEVFLPASVEAWMAAHESKRQEEGDSVELRRSELALLDRAGDEFQERYGAALDAALQAYPDDEKLLGLRVRHLRGRGEVAEAARATEVWIAALEEDNAKKRQWRTLVRTWERLQHPEKTLQAKQALAAFDGDRQDNDPFAGMMVLSPAGVVMGGEEDEQPGLPKTMKDLKAAIEADQLPEAARILRRIWREFPVGEPKQERFFSFWRRSPMASLKWPEADEKTEEEAPDLGGLVGFVDSMRTKEAKKHAESDDDQPSAYERMAQHDELVTEFEVFLTTQSPNQLDRLQALLKGLLAARLRQMGPEASLQDLLARVEQARASKADKILLLASLDQSEGVLPEAARTILADLPRTVAPTDAPQIQRLARVYARGGLQDAALRLFRWCGTQASGSSPYFFSESTGSVSIRELVDAAQELFEGETQLALIEDLLRLADPGDRPWQRESFERLVLNTWADVLPPKQALERARATCEKSIDLRQGLHRDVALRAAGLYAAAGEIDSALRALEVGLAKLDPADVYQPEETWYRSEPQTPNRLSNEDLELLFPPDPEWIGSGATGEAQASEEAALVDVSTVRPGASVVWLQRAGQALSQWLADDRVDEDSTRRALCWIAAQWHRAGETEQAERLLAGMGDPALWSATLRLWWIDTLRIQGQTERALAQERTLLAQGRLHPERIPGLVRSMVETEGAQAALAAVEPIADDTRHPELLAVLIEAATAANDEAQRERWSQAQAAAEAARAQLQALEAKEAK